MPIIALAGNVAIAKDDVQGPGLLKLFAPGLNPALDISPDGSALVYVVSPEDRTHSTIRMRNLATGEEMRLPGHVSQTLEQGLLPTLVRPRWSPDGKRVAYLAERKGELKLFVWDLQSGRSIVFADRTAPPTRQQYDLQWSPDERYVYFLARNKHDPAAHIDAAAGATSDFLRRERRLLAFEDPVHDGVTVRMPNASEEEARPLLPSSLIDVAVADAVSGTTSTVLSGANVNKILLAPDGQKLLVIANDNSDAIGVRQAFQNFFVIDLPDSWRGDSGLEAPFGPEVRNWRGDPIKPDLRRIKQFYSGQASWSPSSDRIAFAEQGALSKGDVFIWDLSAQVPRNLTQQLDIATPSTPMASRMYDYPGKFGQTYLPPIWSRNGRHLYVLRSKSPGHDVWRFDASTGAGEVMFVGGPKDVDYILHRDGIAVETNGRIIVPFEADDGQGGFATLGAERPQVLKILVAHGGWGGVQAPISLVAASQGSRVLAYVNESQNAAPEIYSLDIESRHRERVSDINGGLSAVDLGSVRTITWMRTDGRVGHASVHLPPKKYLADNSGYLPAVFQVYPDGEISTQSGGKYLGREARYLEPLHAMMMAGYAIVVPRMSISPGGGACAKVSEDILGALDAVEETGLVDRKRVGVIGASFGGWAVNCLVTQTDRFSAAVSVAGVSDWVSGSFSLVSSRGSIGGGQLLLGKSIAEAPELYVKDSPVFFLRSVETPLLLVHGKDDVSVPVEQSIEMYVGLADLGKQVSLITYDDRGHVDVREGADYRSRVVQWFDEHLSREPSIRER